MSIYTPEEQAYRKAISIHLPNQCADTMGARVALARMRDQASAGMVSCTEEVRPVLAQVAGRAAEAVYQPMPAKRLFGIVASLNLVLEGARWMEKTYRA